jgi:hypothetical protein
MISLLLGVVRGLRILLRSIFSICFSVYSLIV